ncbi:uncharacterized protein BO88DRAFT_428253 [Aspergillus vadensis CBS 113365]|uniref:Transcription factor domain-containing protein n=1 Tax=Aspergillus vadensis (strain CBS 113365 / IMI 142717 / IBT 24658) TaxID=1448311 RepID=A0A319BRQ2_ASPVC|nr:hypothetical protein BO88DRAFT_428253 [Aspergillus vadensis CBS 113365]PYH65868.1 hypothetical protein BO88DRAFT_428253 [Aspergillus vadensis CBS 113365]
MLDLLGNKKVLISAHQLFHTSERLNIRHNPTSQSSLVPAQADHIVHPQSSIFSLPASQPDTWNSEFWRPGSSPAKPVIGHADQHSEEPKIRSLKPSDLTLLSRCTIVREAIGNALLLDSILALAVLDIIYSRERDSIQENQYDYQQFHMSLLVICNMLIIISFAHVRTPLCSSGSALVDLCQIELAFLVRQGSGPNILNISTLAIHALRKLNNEDSTGNNNPKVPAVFVDLVLDHQPMALIIMAHYCVWWMGIFGIRVIDEICRLLGNDRLGNIQWAIDGISTDCTTCF